MVNADRILYCILFEHNNSLEDLVLTDLRGCYYFPRQLSSDLYIEKHCDIGDGLLFTVYRIKRIYSRKA